MKYKTYAGKPTKYQQKRKNKEISILLGIFFILVSIQIGSEIVSKTKEMAKGINIPNQTQNATTGQLEGNKAMLVIELNSHNPKAEQIVYEASFKACEKHGLATTTPDGTKPSECVKDLVAMAGVETGNYYNFEAVGDLNWGGSYGIFQINSHYHPHITREQAFDPYFSADWTLARMINKGYKENRDFAIRSHNGGMNWRTLAYLNKVNNNK